MAILRPYFSPYLAPAPAQLLQNIQLTPEQRANGYANYFQPQAGQQQQDPNAPQQSEFEQTPYDTKASLQNQANVVSQTRQNQFQYRPVLNDPVAATQTNPIANFVQTSAARPDFSSFYNQLNTISGTGNDATVAAQQQAQAHQASVINQVGSSGGAVSGNFNDRVSIAKSLIGVPYVWGHQDKNGTDCSGLVYQVLNATGTKVPRVTAAEYGRMGQSVSLSSAMPGDVVYFDEPGATDHVGIYIGNGQMIDAPNQGARVRVDRVGNYTSIRRIGGTGQTGISAGANALVPKQFNSVQQLGQQLLAQKGWGNQWNSFNQLETHEAGWNPTAQNPSSTAYGLGQFLNSTWAPYGAKTSDPRLQLNYMLDYIKSRYGDPNRAWAFWQQHHWY